MLRAAGVPERALPPSLRLLGRRCYLEAVVLVAAMVAQVVTLTARTAIAATGVPLRTLRRWVAWWRGTFPKTRLWAELRARFIPPPPREDELPRSLVARLAAERWAWSGASDTAVSAGALLLAARHLAPATTASVAEGSRFVTAALATVGAG